MHEISLAALLDTAVAAARLGGRHTLQYFKPNSAQTTAVEFKSDKSPVTQADREAELIIRDAILEKFPAHSVLGEEHGSVIGDPDYQWVIDPIDGTKSFIHGVPLYTTLIGLQIKGRPAIGVIYVPAADDMVFAAEGLGATWNDKPACVSTIDQMSDALLLTTNINDAIDRSDAFSTLARQCKYSRTWGDGYGYYLVATGRAEIMIDPQMNPWDCAAIIPIIHEAGGWCSSWAGQVTIDGGDLFACNAKLAGQVRHVLER